MIDKLLKITLQDIDGNSVQVVNAKDLHRFLASKKDFLDWIKEQIEKFGFVENKEFVHFVNSRNEHHKRYNCEQYLININMAKQISKMKGNSKGKRAQQYFDLIIRASSMCV